MRNEIGFDFATKLIRSSGLGPEYHSVRPRYYLALAPRGPEQMGEADHHFHTYAAYTVCPMRARPDREGRPRHPAERAESHGRVLSSHAP